MNGLGALALATLAFVGAHFLLSSPPIRGPLATRLGERAFSGAYSVVVAAAFVWMLLTYASAPFVSLWEAPSWTKSLVALVMPLSTLLFVGSVTQRNPTMGPPGITAPASGNIAGMLKITRHPMLWSFGLWAVAHLIASGHAKASILFGGLTVLSLVGTLAIDAKRSARDPEGYGRFIAATSNVPFVAIVRGKARLSYADIGWWRLLLAALLYFALVFAHPIIAGQALV